ncbi:MAG TPA: hypothetical protein H9768_06030 [Candidatus Mailhella merdavium]|nr:hypothetical protein [Candidatus Mailhella merdavium]
MDIALPGIMLFLLLSGRVALEPIDLSGRYYLPADSVHSTIDAYMSARPVCLRATGTALRVVRWMLRCMCIVVP